jgi:uncharacterized protein YuzE
MRHEYKTQVAAYTYIQLNDGDIHNTEDRGNLLLDLAEDGTILGIELLTPGRMCGCWTGEEES